MINGRLAAVAAVASALALMVGCGGSGMGVPTEGRSSV